jgi:hypothetical protein
VPNFGVVDVEEPKEPLVEPAEKRTETYLVEEQQNK